MELEPVIGLEVHVQLQTATKLFAPATCVFGREPNTQVDPVSLGLPGSLPVLNQRAVELAVTAAAALGCEIHERSRFDRKHYFYPDLPKGYQISQFDEPYCTGGGVTIDLEDGSERLIELTRIHMEEDAGKLVHVGSHSAVDLNRAGTPLCEIVSEPVIRTPQEAWAYLVELRRILRWCGVSDCEMQEGSLRCDANVSIRPAGSNELNTKVEIKNLNSFRAVEAAIAFEIEHQAALWRAGRRAEITQQTKLWDPDAKVTTTMREKEGSDDYRYFPDPDLPTLFIPQNLRERVTRALPELPRARAARLVAEHGLKAEAARELTMERAVADYFEAVVAAGAPPRGAANWVREEGFRLAEETGLAIAEAVPAARLAELVRLVDDGLVARVVAKEHCKDHPEEVFRSGDSTRAWFEAQGLIQERDDSAIEAWCQQVIAAHPEVAEQVRSGNTKAIGRLVGQTMKLSAGKADPKAVKGTLERLL